MSVIINDFEVVVEPPAESAGGPTQAQQGEVQPPPLGPRDVRDIVRRQAVREARVRAH